MVASDASYCSPLIENPNAVEQRIIDQIGAEALLQDLIDAEEECGL